MNSVALPSTAGPRRNKLAVYVGIPAGVALLAVGALWGGYALFGGKSGPTLTPGMFHTVLPMDLDVKINKDGELQAVNNIDIICQVEGQNTITQIVKEGATVKKGDVLITIDSSSIRQKIEDTTLELQKAEADLTTSRELKDIQESQNSANLQASEVALILAQLDLKQYQEGTYPQQLENAKTTVEMARITLKNTDEDLDQTMKLFAKGFVTAAEVKKSELAVTNARNGLAQAASALNVLTNYSHQMDSASKRNTLAQAEQRLARTKRENASNMSQKQADVDAKSQALGVLKRRMTRFEEQFAHCTIKAPADGLVVYATSGDRNNQNPIQEGAQVRERQQLLRLPDTSAMKAVVRIPESQVTRLSEGLRANVKVVGMKDTIGATLSRISVLADSGSRWWNPDLKEYPVELTLDYTPPDLKPGVGAQTEIFIRRLEQVTATPIATVYSAGADSYVFRRAAETMQPVKVMLGANNDTHIEIVDGIEPGAQLLILQSGQGRTLLEDAGIKITPLPTTRPGGERRRRPEGSAPPTNAPPTTAAPGVGSR